MKMNKKMSKRKQIDLTKFGFTKRSNNDEKNGKESEKVEQITTSEVSKVSANVNLANVSIASTSLATTAESGAGALLTLPPASNPPSKTLSPASNPPSSSSGPPHREIDEETVPSNVTSDIPNVWTASQCKEWQERQPWIFFNGGCIGCLTCKEAKLLLGPERGVHLSSEWGKGIVRSDSAKIMRNKIYKHRNSVAHKQANEMAKLKKRDVIPNIIIEASSHQFNETEAAFRTAYCIAKERMSFTKMGPLIELQEQNGSKMGNVHRSDHSCAEISTHLASEMKRTMISNLKKANSPISISIDESSVYGLTYLIIYLRSDISGNGDLENIFLNLVELKQGTDAASIYSSLRESLRDAGLNDEWLSKHLISIATDGASVLTGKVSGLIARLKTDFPNVQAVHCLAHRLELAVHDSLKAVTGTNYFDIFISKLYAIYHQSPKNTRLLKEAALALETRLLQIGKIFTIRWVASSFKTVKAVWQDFPALAKQLKEASEDPKRTDADRRQFSGLHNQLVSKGFVADLACMKDVLRELQSLSLKLQRRDTTLNQSSRDITQTIEVLTAMKETGGKSFHVAKERIATATFHGVQLVDGKEKINRLQFHQSVVDNLVKRLPDSDLVQLLKPLDKSCWPADRGELVLFGEREVHKLAKLLGEPSREAVEEYRDWKLQGTEGGTLRRLVIAGKTFLPSSAECERGFSALNDIDCKTRNRLREQSLSALLFLDVNGPPLEYFNPKPFVRSWLKAGHRLSASWKPGKDAKRKEKRPLWDYIQ